MFHIAAKGEVLLEMLAQPHAGHGAVGPDGTALAEVADRVAECPDVGVVVDAPPAAVVAMPGRHCARLGQVTDEAQQGFVALGEVGGLGGPIIGRISGGGAPLWLTEQPLR